MPAAKNAFKRMKMLRHPNVLMFQDGVENDKAVFIATERVQPLYNYLKESKESDSQKHNEIAWGLYQIATALHFLNNDCKIVHNNVCMSSVVVNRAGEWKLTGFEYSHLIDDSNVPLKILSTLDRYEPPEKSPIASLKTAPNRNMIQTESGVDSWGLGCLIWEIFNSCLLPNPNSLQTIGNKMPKSLSSSYQGLLYAQLNKRLNMAKFLANCREKNSFMDNHFVQTLLFLEEIQVSVLFHCKFLAL
jgi:SCY1-like protein 1